MISVVTSDNRVVDSQATVFKRRVVSFGVLAQSSE